MLLLTISTHSQENRWFRLPSWSEADTVKVLQLINNGAIRLYNNQDSAMRLFKKALQISQDKAFDDGIGYALAFMGFVACNQGKYEEGFAYYKKAIPYCQNAKYIKNALPVLYINMGTSYVNRADYAMANRYYYRAMEYLQKYLPEDKNIFAVYSNLTSIQVHQGNYRLALSGMDSLYRIAEKNIPLIAGQTMLNKGNIYGMLQMYDSAMFCFKKALHIARKNNYTSLEQACLTSMGNNLMLTGENYRQAIDYYEQAIQLSEQTHILYGVISPGYNTGLAWYKLKEYDKAEKVLLASLSKAEKTGLVENKEHAHATLVNVYEATGRYKEALQQQRLASSIKDSVMNEEKVRVISEVENKYQSEQKDKQIAEARLKESRQEVKLKSKNILIVGISAALLLAFVLALLFFVLYRSGRIRQHLQEQQLRNLHREQEIKQLKATIQGEEKERVRIARELHEGIVSQLTGIQLHLSSTVDEYKGVVLQSSYFRNTLQYLAEVTQDLRRTTHNLMPEGILKEGLISAVSSLCHKISKTSGVDVTFQTYGKAPRFDIETELSLFRIIQELLQNIIKHSGATQALVQFNNEDTCFRLTVEDDGKGFDTTTDSPKGIGLENIRERLKVLNGNMEIDSDSNGTSVYIEMREE